MVSSLTAQVCRRRAFIISSLLHQSPSVSRSTFSTSRYLFSQESPSEAIFSVSPSEEPYSAASAKESKHAAPFTRRVGVKVKDSNKKSTSTKMTGPGDSTRKFLAKQAPHRWIDPVMLRDSCACLKCVDPSTKQKNFQTTDIPTSIEPQLVEGSEWTYTWKNDIPGWGDHTSEYSPEYIKTYGPRRTGQLPPLALPQERTWGTSRIHTEMQYLNYTNYMRSDIQLYRALQLLQLYGILIIRNVPPTENSVSRIALRIGTIRDTFYGRTWDVKSVPEAKNVAYTHKFLGLHQDLLYMRNPPGLQLLHCLKNTCEGGASLFADGFHIASQLDPTELISLRASKIPYHYNNAGEHYLHSHPVVETFSSRLDTVNRPTLLRKFRAVNFSPPFQSPQMDYRDPSHATFLRNFRKLTQIAESKENLLEYKLQEGECVIFDNRRIFHGRRAFDAEGGERWLKGTYVDTDVLDSRFRAVRTQVARKGPKKYSDWKTRVKGGGRVFVYRDPGIEENFLDEGEFDTEEDAGNTASPGAVLEEVDEPMEVRELLSEAVEDVEGETPLESAEEANDIEDVVVEAEPKEEEEHIDSKV